MRMLDDPMPRGLPAGVGVAPVTIFRDNKVDIEATIDHAQTWHASFVDFPNGLKPESGAH
jgi:dihydrodipicolinate synthase/N-acetylneuraminate lyase